MVESVWGGSFLSMTKEMCIRDRRIRQLPEGVERVFPQDVAPFQRGAGPDGSRSPVVVDDGGCLGEDVYKRQLEITPISRIIAASIWRTTSAAM